MLEAHANTNETNLRGPLIWILFSEAPRMLAQNERESGNGGRPDHVGTVFCLRYTCGGCPILSRFVRKGGWTDLNLEA
jgi:hypothetical protein